MKKRYELALILSPELTENEAQASAEKIKSSLEKKDGSILYEDFWGKLDLAYKIQKQSNGFYFLYEMEIDGKHIKEIEKELSINKDVMRYLTTIVSVEYESMSFDEICKEGEKSPIGQKEKKEEKPVKKEFKKKVVPRKKVVKKKEEANFDKEKLNKVLSDDFDI